MRQVFCRAGTTARERSLGWFVILAIFLAFSFLGTRGLWDPDEGRYTNVALTMLDGGNWLDPMRNDDTGHWTKPPMTYWLLASSFSVFGRNTWAARVPSALAFLACIALAWACAKRLVPGTQRGAALAYATMVLPFSAGQLVTTDFPMTALQTLGVFAFVESRFGSGRRGWVLLMWMAFGLAFLTKGPPAVIALIPILALHLLASGERRGHAVAHAVGFILFLAIALPWFAAVTLRHQGLMDYFLGAEVVDRLASDRFGRNGQWYGWASVYLPTLMLGVLPWVFPAWRWLHNLPAEAKTWRHAPVRAAQAGPFFIALWFVLPLLVFCIARSRLPLYILPIFVPLAIAIAMQWQREQRGLPRTGLLVLWIIVLVSSRLLVANVNSRQDTSAWAEAIRARASGPVHEVVFVEDTPRYGLHLHLSAEVETLSLEPLQQPKFNPKYDEPLIRELQESEGESGVVYVAKASLWTELQRRISAYGYRAVALGSPYHERVFFKVQGIPGKPNKRSMIQLPAGATP